MFKRKIVVLVMAVVLMLSVVAAVAVPAMTSGSEDQISVGNLENLLSGDSTSDDFQIMACAPQCPGPGNDGS